LISLTQVKRTRVRERFKTTKNTLNLQKIFEYRRMVPVGGHEERPPQTSGGRSMDNIVAGVVPTVPGASGRAS
jgi:hypothetical protein